MRTLLKIIIALLTTSLFAQKEIGLGIISINLDEKTPLSFYSLPNDKIAKRTIEFFDDKTINSWNIKNFNKHKSWLKPELLWLDNSSLFFRYVTIKDNWIKVIVNYETGETFWIKKSKMTIIKNWEKYLIDMFGVSRLPNEPQKIKSLPINNSKDIKYEGQDCFQVKSVKGDWIEIFTANYCDEDNSKSKTKIKSGWIKWREKNKLLIEYYTTS